MNRARISALTAALVLPGCTLPERSNPFDATNAPEAGLVVFDRGVPRGADGRCPVLDSSESAGWVQSLTAGRGTCLVLDARGSEDPDGFDSVSYLLLGSAGQPAVAALEVDIVGETQTLGLVQPDSLLSVPLGTTLRFRAVVTDGPVERTADSPIQFVNTPPAARVDPSRSYPLGGFPWAPAATFRIVFDGSRSSDADGDPLAFQWSVPTTLTQVGGCGSSDETCTVEVASGTPSRELVTLAVHDGTRASTPVVSEVRVREIDPWLTTEINDGASLGYLGTARLDPTFSRVNSFTGVLTDAAYLEVDGTGRVLFGSQFDPIASAPWPVQDGATLTYSTAPAEPTQIEVDRVAGRVWVVFDDGAPTRDVAAYELSGSALVNVVPPTAVVVSDGFTGGRDLLTTEPDGTLWVSGGNTPHLVVLSVTGATLATGELASGRAFAALAARPDHPGEVWAVESHRGFEGSIVPARLLQLGRSGTSIVELGAWELGSSEAAGAAWTPDDRLWVRIAGRGIALVDPERLAQGFDAALDVLAEEVYESGPVVVDDVTGVAFASTITHFNYFRVTPDGTVSEHLTSDAMLPLFVGPLGEVWMAVLQEQRLRVGTGSFDGTAAEIRRAMGSLPGVVRDGNSIWLSALSPAVLVRVSENGDVLDEVHGLQLPGGLTQFTLSGALSLDEDGEAAWSAGIEFVLSDGVITEIRFPLFRYHLNDRPEPGIITGESLGVLGSLFEVGTGTVFRGSVLADPPFLWTAINDFFSGPVDIIRVDLDGTQTTEFSAPGYPAEQIATGMFARAGVTRFPGNDSLCVVTEQETASDVWTVRIYKVTSGVVTGAPVVTLTRGLDIGPLGPVRATGASGTNECWVSLLSGTGGTRLNEVIAFNATTGAQIERYSDAIESDIHGVLPSSLNRVWLLREGADINRSIPVRLDHLGSDSWTATDLPEVSRSALTF